MKQDSGDKLFSDMVKALGISDDELKEFRECNEKLHHLERSLIHTSVYFLTTDLFQLGKEQMKLAIPVVEANLLILRKMIEMPEEEVRKLEPLFKAYYLSEALGRMKGNYV